MTTIHTTMSAQDYHTHPAISKSLLDQVARSPLHARAYLDGQRKRPTSAMSLGTALHAAVLEPVSFGNQYVVFGGDRRTKAGREEFDSIRDAGRIAIDPDDLEAVTGMARSLSDHPALQPILGDDDAQREASVFWEDGGLQMKCRPDWWLGETIIDIKTTRDASIAGFARSLARYRYHVQAAHYMQGTGATRFLFAVVESEAPYASAVYELDETALQMGQETRARDLASLAASMEMKVWPGYPSEIQTIALPAWVVTGDEE